jgi:hypothetical protein
MVGRSAGMVAEIVEGYDRAGGLGLTARIGKKEAVCSNS